MTLLVLAACADDAKDDTAADPGTWTTVAEDLPGALLSVWGTSAGDVWTVGADPGDGGTIRHLSSGAWSTMSHAGTLWWVTGVGDAVWTVGANGAGVRIAGDQLAETTLDPEKTYFGVWGASEDEIWAVGGDPDVISDAATIWRYDGAAWAEVEIPAEAAAAIAIYKVWGSAADDVWAVGTGGVVLHWDGAAWTSATSATTRNLFTVHGAGAGEAYAVGGEFSGTVTRWDGAAWTDETPTTPMPQLNGVHVGVAGPVAVGTQGAVWRRDGGWTEDARGPASTEDFHAVWTDETGGIWAVGGHLASYPQINGTLVYGGDGPAPPTF
jgi:hypothetical protein